MFSATNKYGSFFSYIADASVPRSRTWRIGIAEAFWQLGSPVGLFFGAFLFEKGGYLCVFGASFACHLLGVLYTAFILPEIPSPKPQKTLVFGKYGNYGTYTNEISAARRARCFSENETGNRSTVAAAGAVTDEDNNNATKFATLDENTSLIIGGASRKPSQVSLPFPPPPSSPATAYQTGNPEAKQLENDSNEPTSVYGFIIGSLKAIVKPRENHKRKCLLSLGTIMLLYGICFYGEEQESLWTSHNLVFYWY